MMKHYVIRTLISSLKNAENYIDNQYRTLTSVATLRVPVFFSFFNHFIYIKMHLLRPSNSMKQKHDLVIITILCTRQDLDPVLLLTFFHNSNL